jgi:dihydropyrimidinase
VAQVELAVRNGTVVTAHARFRADLGISGGRVVAIEDSVAGATEIDAGGKLVLPGGVDAHVHLTPSTLSVATDRVDDFESGTRAAAIGGVTTIGNMSYTAAGELMSEALERIAADAAATSIVDFVLHPVLASPSPELVADVDRLADSGTPSVKIFMVTAEFDARSAEFMKALDAAARRGLVAMIHCEDHGLVEYATRRLLDEGRGRPRDYALARPDVSEELAVRRAIAMGRLTGATIYIVHLASRAALAAVVEAREQGLRVFAETRPIYLFFTAGAFDLPDGALYTGNPPLRDRRDVEAIWDGLRLGEIDTYCSDHAPWAKAAKLDPERDVRTVRPGVSDLGTLMPLLFSEGVRRGRIGVEQFVALTATNAAQIFGLYPRKGALEVGSDADVVVWDPDAERTLTTGDVVGNADFTLYEGWRVTGWPEVTISRGEVVYADGAVTGTPGRGVWVRRERVEAERR